MQYTTQLLARRWLAETVFEIELSRPETFDFFPGQYLRFCHDTREREYSMVSAPTDSTLSLLVRHLQAGQFSPILASVPLGTDFSFSGPYGYFLFQPSERTPVFVATGTGIAPFISMVRSGVKDCLLVHGERTISDLYYKELFREQVRHYQPCLSRIPWDTLSEGMFAGTVAEYLKTSLPRGTYDFYLCGHGDMIRDVTFLIDEQFPDSFARSEAFYEIIN